MTDRKSGPPEALKEIAAKESAKLSQDASKAEPEKRAPLSNYFRILTFGSRTDHVLLVVGMICAAASGVALPLMNIVFGNLVGDFNSYFIPGTTTTKSEFMRAVSRNSLYITYLFIAKFVLTYIGAVSCPLPRIL
jgi:ATP-binding cassette, subfamily B (MDR/TAP), member 1